MKADGGWTPWFAREWLTYKVARRVYADAFGSGYVYARNRAGLAKRFWTRKRAQEYADLLNARAALAKARGESATGGME